MILLWEIHEDDGISDNFNRKERILKLRKSSPDKSEFFTSGVLSRNVVWKFQFTLIKNGGRKDFLQIGIYFIGKNIKKEEYSSLLLSLTNFISLKKDV